MVLIRGRLLRIALGLVLAGGLSACQTSGPRTGVLGDGPSARGVPVALESIDGLPERMSADVRDAIIAEASRRSMDVVGPGQPARFRVKGYISAYGSEEGTTVSVMWDVFDASHVRAKRITTTATTPGTAEDAWSRVDEHQIAAVARKSIGELATFLASRRDGDPSGVEDPQRSVPGGPAGKSALAYARE
jgi:hypothetical protein